MEVNPLEIGYNYIYHISEGIFMMRKQDKQIQMIILDMNSIVPENHLLRKIKNCINFDFIYEKASPYYAKMAENLLIRSFS